MNKQDFLHGYDWLNTVDLDVNSASSPALASSNVQKLLLIALACGSRWLTRRETELMLSRMESKWAACHETKISATLVSTAEQIGTCYVTHRYLAWSFRGCCVELGVIQSGRWRKFSSDQDDASSNGYKDDWQVDQIPFWIVHYNGKEERKRYTKLMYCRCCLFKQVFPI